MLTLYLHNQPVADSTRPGYATVQAWEALDLRCTPPPGTRLHLELHTPLQTVTLPPTLRPDDPTWYWQWNPQNSTGEVRLTLRAQPPSRPPLTLWLTIMPHRLEANHYARLLDDLWQLAHQVLLRLSAHSTIGAALSGAPVSPAVLNSLGAPLAAQVATLERICAQAARQPATRSSITHTRVPIDQVRDFAHVRPATPGDLPAAPDELPPALIRTHSQPTADSPENRLLKHVLQTCWQRARQLATLAPPNTPLATQGHTLQARLQKLRTAPWLAAVGPVRTLPGPTRTMQRHPAYRQLWRLWHELRRAPALALASPLFDLPAHDLPYLYECWCALHTVTALLALPDSQPIHQQLVQPARHAPHWLLALPTEQPLLTLRWRGLTLRLRYQPRYAPGGTPFGALDAHAHVPDLALEVDILGQPPALLVLDAKYRRAPDGSLPTAALADGYTYLGSIGSADGQRAVHGVALLYPAKADTPAAHYASGISVLPLLPGHTSDLADWLTPRLAQLVARL